MRMRSSSSLSGLHLAPAGFLHLLCLCVVASLSGACSPRAETPCDYHDDCATPREYCSSQTNVCTLYECIEDGDCKKNERCNLILNSCELIPTPDMAMSDMPPDRDDGSDFGPVTPDMRPDRDLGMDPEDARHDSSPPVDMNPGPQDLGDRTPPSLVAVSPVEGSSITRETASWRIMFDEPLDARSVSPFTIMLTNAEKEELAIDVTLDATGQEILVTLAMDELFAPSSQYELSISEQVRDTSLNSLGRREEMLYYPAIARDEDNHTLAMKWAPSIYQEVHDPTSGQWRHDIPTRIDFDADFTAANNLSALTTLPEESYHAAAYYHVAQTPTHHFITYIYYYPSRLSIDPMGNVPTYDEHDFTGVLLVIERATDELLIAEGLRVEESTDVLIAFTNADRASEVSLPGEGRIRGSFSSSMFSESARYPLYIPSGRHEACYWPEPDVRPPYDVCVHPDGAFRSGTQGVLLEPSEEGMTWSEASAVTDPSSAPYATTMTYELIAFDELFWHKRSLVGSDLLFNRRRTYTPDGGRPSLSPDGSPILIPQSLPYDTSLSQNSYGKTPYNWLTQPARSNRGQWLIDPAWTIPQRYIIPQMPVWSYDYCYNLTLGVDLRTAAGCQTVPPSP